MGNLEAEPAVREAQDLVRRLALAARVNEQGAARQAVAERAPPTPESIDPRPVALLLVAAGAALDGGSVEPLRALTALRYDANVQTRAAAKLAIALLDDLDTLHRTRAEGQPANGDRVAKVASPEEAEALNVLFGDSPAWTRFVDRAALGFVDSAASEPVDNSSLGRTT